MMKKILVVGMTPTYGGMESVVVNYVRHMHGIQFDFLVHFPQKIAYEDELKALGCTFYRVPKKSVDYPRYRKGMKDFFRKRSSDYGVLWVNSCHFINMDYYVLAKKYGIPCRIFHAHNSNAVFPSLPRRVYSLVKEKSNMLVQRKYVNEYWACSTNAAAYLFNRQTFDSHTYTIIHNAIDLSRFRFSEALREKTRAELGLDKDALLIGHIGRFEKAKNHAFLIRIFAEIYARNPQARLLLIGDGSLTQSVKDEVTALNLSNVVLFTGQIPDPSAYYHAMDVFVLPSLYEGLPMVAVEAQANGLPCVFADSISTEAGLSESVRFISLQKPVNEWADAILKAPANTERASAWQHLRDEGFDIQAEASKMEQFFRQKLSH